MTDDNANEWPAARESILAQAASLPGNPPSKDARILFIRSVMQDLRWSRGESAGPLAEVWGLSKATVEHNAAEAWRMLKDPANREAAAAYIADVSRERSHELWERARMAADRDAAALASAAGQSLDTLGKVTGAISSAPVTNILVDARGTLRPDVRALLEACCRAAVASGCDPSEYRERLAGELGATVPRTAIEAVAVPDALAPQERARLLLGELAETWGELDDASELVPVLRVMMGE